MLCRNCFLFHSLWRMTWIFYSVLFVIWMSTPVKLSLSLPSQLISQSCQMPSEKTLLGVPILVTFFFFNWNLVVVWHCRAPLCTAPYDQTRSLFSCCVTITIKDSRRWMWNIFSGTISPRNSPWTKEKNMRRSGALLQNYELTPLTEIFPIALSEWIT